MSKSYYEVSSDELIKRLNNLRYGNIVDFFRNSDEFVLAITLAYFTLAEELLIERNSKDFNISTRFKKNISDGELNNLLTDDINIRDKEKDGNSVEWFLSALRNGIIHNGFEVDYDNKVVNVINAGALNKLDCSVSFDWFENFTLSDLLLKRTLEDYKYTMVFNPFVKSEQANYMRTYDDIKKFIENDLFAYDIEISINDAHSDKTKLRRDEFIQFCKEREHLFWILMNFPEDLKQTDLDRFEKYQNLVTVELINEKDNLNEEEYNKRYYNRLFNYWFSDEFKNKYPNYNISISMFDRKSPKLNMVISDLKEGWLEKQLFTTRKKKEEFFDEFSILQRMDVSRGISKIVNYDQVDYLVTLQYLLGMYFMHRDVVRDDYGLSKFMKKIMNSNKVLDHRTIEENYMKAIHDGMLEEGIVHSYDKQITTDIIWNRDYRDGDVFVRCRQLCKDIEDEFLADKKNEIMNILKSEYPDYYANVSSMLEEEGAPSDQVLAVYNENDLYRLGNAKGVIKEQFDEIIIGLLYTLGINTYVVNKETSFSTLNENDYSFMDNLNIKGYSKDSYTRSEEYRQRKRSNSKHISAINNTIQGIKRGIASIVDPIIINDKNTRISLLDRDKKQFENDNVVCDNYLNNRSDEVYGGINMSSLSNLECATTIRNCFAHGGRIFIDGREPGCDIRLVLTDYDEKGNLSGVVKTDLSSIINFFSNPVLKNAMSKQDNEIDVSEKSK